MLRRFDKSSDGGYVQRKLSLFSATISIRDIENNTVHVVANIHAICGCSNGPPEGQKSSRGGGDQPPSQAAPSGAEQMSSLQRYRSQTMKDYGLMIEYKHLRQHVPGGIYVLPSFDETRIWYGTIFIHSGLYRNGIFKFTIFLPEKYVC